MKKFILMMCVVALMMSMILTVSAKIPLEDMDKWTLIEQHEKNETYNEKMMLDPQTQTLFGVLVGHDGSIPGGCVVIPCEGESFESYIRTDKNTVVWSKGDSLIINTFSKDWSLLDTETLEDVKPGAWYTNPVLWAKANGITRGMDVSHFAPNNKCTRAQIVTFLWRTAGKPEPKSQNNPFTDVDPKAFYGKAMLWAVENGITKGTSETTFSPDKECTRGEIVTFMWRCLNSPKSTNIFKFEDAKSGFFKEAVAWAVETGVTFGKTPTEFAPNDTCTRAEAVTFLYRLSSF